MQRTELLEFIRDTLSNAGYYISDAYFIRSIGFDLVARRDNSLLIIKALTNINSFPEEIAEELKKLAHHLGGHPLLIGLRTGSGILETGVVYDRFGIQAINPETLYGHLLEGLPLKVYAAPGGFYANIDTDKLIKIRKKQNLSKGNFARYIHVSRRMVRMYEDGMNARIDIASRIEDVLNEQIIKPIDIINQKREPQSNQQKKLIYTPFDYNDPLKHEIFSLLNKLGYTIIPLGKCPFEAVSREQEKIILTCVQTYDQRIKDKAKVVTTISNITEKQAVFFTDKKGTKNHIEGTPLIIRAELKKLKDPEDIIELIIERRCKET
jgi:putative transcriptional regulator